MRARIAIMAALCLLVALPMNALATKPSGTTKISQATAFFTAHVPNQQCETDHLIVTFGGDAYRSVGPEDKPPVYGYWLDVQVWHESGCTDTVVSGYTQQTLRDLEPGTYALDELSSAFVDVAFPINDDEGAQVRTLALDLAWVAYGPKMHVVDHGDAMTITGWDRDAHLTGTVGDSAELISAADLDYAAMGLGNYVMR
jgi:hypothetical protein